MGLDVFLLALAAAVTAAPYLLTLEASAWSVPAPDDANSRLAFEEVIPQEEAA